MTAGGAASLLPAGTLLSKVRHIYPGWLEDTVTINRDSTSTADGRRNRMPARSQFKRSVLYLDEAALRHFPHRGHDLYSKPPKVSSGVQESRAATKRPR